MDSSEQRTVRRGLTTVSSRGGVACAGLTMATSELTVANAKLDGVRRGEAVVRRGLTVVNAELFVVDERLTQVNRCAPGDSRQVSSHREAAPPEHGRRWRPTTEQER